MAVKGLKLLRTKLTKIKTLLLSTLWLNVNLKKSSEVINTDIDNKCFSFS